MGQVSTEQSRETAWALGRFHEAVKEQNVLHRRLGDELGPLVDDLFHPDTAEKAMAVADYLDHEFRSDIRRMEEALRFAMAADEDFRQVLGANADTLNRRLRGLERLAEPVRRATASLAAPARTRIPFSLIHDGLEFIEQLRRHHAWTAENILPAVVFHHRRALAEAGSVINERQSGVRVEFDGVTDMSIECPRTKHPIGSLQALIRDLQEICGAGNAARTNVSPA